MSTSDSAERGGKPRRWPIGMELITVKSWPHDTQDRGVLNPATFQAIRLCTPGRDEYHADTRAAGTTFEGLQGAALHGVPARRGSVDG